MLNSLTHSSLNELLTLAPPGVTADNTLLEQRTAYLDQMINNCQIEWPMFGGMSLGEECFYLLCLNVEILLFLDSDVIINSVRLNFID